MNSLEFHYSKLPKSTRNFLEILGGFIFVVGGCYLLSWR